MNLFENSMYFFSKFHKRSNALICIASDKRQWHIVTIWQVLAKIAEGASPRRHAETSLVKVKDTHLMNNKLPPAEILCGDCFYCRACAASDMGLSASVPLPIVMGIFVLLGFQSS